MNQPDTTRRLSRTAQAVQGGRAARRHLARTDVIARQLADIAQGTVRVRTVPVRTVQDGTERRSTRVMLADAEGRPVAADREAHRATLGLLARMLPGVDRSRPLTYDARTGRFTADEPTAPVDLGLDTAEEPRP
ncbi:hypothetical protein [Streptomyces sp. NPDC021622]|uniref:hypothetical protein n=1 Tax=Streptomyces sp. NPDC021622 TaxID=3155013 RepID=UPI0033E4DEF7